MTQDSIIAALARCSQLGKRTFPYRLPQPQLWYETPTNALTVAMSKVLGGITVQHDITRTAGWQGLVRNAGQMAVACNAQIGIQLSPWTAKAPTDLGEPFIGELTAVCDSLRGIADALGDVGAGGLVTMAMVDHPPYTTKDGDQRWNDCLTARHSIMYHLIRQCLGPAVQVEQWQRFAHGYQPWDSARPTAPKRFYTGDESGDFVSVPLMCLPDEIGMRSVLQASVDAVRGPNPPVFAWIGLGGGYRRKIGASAYLDREWDYDTIYPWQIGRHLYRSAYSPWLHVRAVGISADFPTDYGHPFWRQLVALCYGANGIAEEPE